MNLRSQIPGKVSVIIPSYNSGNYLAEAIDSVEQQTRENWEVIVVDDGSTDETCEIAKSYYYLQYIRQENKGMAAARNAGIDASKGEYLVFLDADDRLLENALHAGSSALRENKNFAFVYGFLYLVDRNGIRAETPKQPAINSYISLLQQNPIWTPGVVMYRRSAVSAVKGFRSRAESSADFDLNIRLARSARFLCHREYVLEYRQHGKNATCNNLAMLRSSITARRMQRHVLHGPTEKAAWRQGIKFMQSYYGHQVAEEAKRALRYGEGCAFFQCIVSLIRYYPAGLFEILGRKPYNHASRSVSNVE